jgi:hypothetical protein
VALRDRLATSSAEEANDAARTALRGRPAPHALEIAVTILLQCRKTTDVELLRDLLLAKCSCDSQVFHAVEDDAVRDLFTATFTPAAQRTQIKLRAGDVALLWPASDGSDGVEKLRAIVAAAIPPRGASWYSEWFSITAAQRFDDAVVRATNIEGFVKYLARRGTVRNLRSKKDEDPDRERLARAMVTEWSGSLASLDETITMLLVEALPTPA